MLVLHNRNIRQFIRPSKIYLLMKVMQLENTEVTRRPNVNKVITNLYGLIACTWSEFDGARRNLRSFVVWCRDEYIVVWYLSLFSVLDLLFSYVVFNTIVKPQSLWFYWIDTEHTYAHISLVFHVLLVFTHIPITHFTQEHMVQKIHNTHRIVGD